MTCKYIIKLRWEVYFSLKIRKEYSSFSQITYFRKFLRYFFCRNHSDFFKWWKGVSQTLCRNKRVCHKCVKSHLYRRHFLLSPGYCKLQEWSSTGTLFYILKLSFGIKIWVFSFISVELNADMEGHSNWKVYLGWSK